MRPGKRRSLPITPDGKLQDLIEAAKLHVRAKVEHPKNRCKVNVIAALTNLYFALRLLLLAI